MLLRDARRDLLFKVNLFDAVHWVYGADVPRWSMFTLMQHWSIVQHRSKELRAEGSFKVCVIHICGMECDHRIKPCVEPKSYIISNKSYLRMPFVNRCAASWPTNRFTAPIQAQTTAINLLQNSPMWPTTVPKYSITLFLQSVSFPRYLYRFFISQPVFETGPP